MKPRWKLKKLKEYGDNIYLIEVCVEDIEHRTRFDWVYTGTILMHKEAWDKMNSESGPSGMVERQIIVDT